MQMDNRGIPEWAIRLAVDINNQFEIGMDGKEIQTLAVVILRRARKAFEAVDREAA